MPSELYRRAPCCRSSARRLLTWWWLGWLGGVWSEMPWGQSKTSLAMLHGCRIIRRLWMLGMAPVGFHARYLQTKLRCAPLKDASTGCWMICRYAGCLWSAELLAHLYCFNIHFAAKSELANYPFNVLSPFVPFLFILSEHTIFGTNLRDWLGRKSLKWPLFVSGWTLSLHSISWSRYRADLFTSFLTLPWSSPLSHSYVRQCTTLHPVSIIFTFKVSSIWLITVVPFYVPV